MEGEVLLEAAERLHRVREIRMEVHQTRERPNVLQRVVRLLRDAGFKVQSTARNLRDVLPPAAMPWFELHAPEIHVLAASRAAA
jgi:hypothetical protein